MSAKYTFGDAIAALKQGKTVARAGWNGKGMFLFINRGSADFSGGVSLKEIDGVSPDLFDEGDIGTVARLPNINMRAASGATVTGWLASQTDILAEDWIIIDHGAEAINEAAPEAA